MLAQTKPFGIFSIILAGIMVLFLVAGIGNFPSYQWGLVVSLALYVVALYRFPFLWLYVLITMSVSINLAPWTGRYIIDELDFFVAATIAILSIVYRKIRSEHRLLLPWLFVTLAVIVSFSPEWANAFGPQYFNFYLSPLFGLSIVKGMVWAVLLCWLFNKQRQHDSKLALKHFMYAVILASVAIFLTILWEKQVLPVLFSGEDIWTKANAFLNITSAYRTTGLIAGMHTGGESIDGIYLFLLPVTLAAFFVMKDFKQRMFALMGLGGVLYCVLMGFTRATYAASFLVIVTIVLLNIWFNRANNQSDSIEYESSHRYLVWLYTGYPIFFVSIFLLHQSSGFYAELSGALIYGISLLLMCYSSLTKKQNWIFLGAISLAFVWINFDSVQDSQWVELDAETAWSTIFSSVGALVGLFFIYLGYLRLKTKFTVPKIFLNTVVVAGLLIVIASVLAGTRINIRAENNARDFDTRTTHWQEIIQSGHWSIGDILLGHGKGAMPTNYSLTSISRIDEVGNFSVDRDKSALTVTPGSDLMIGQRFSVKTDSTYLAELTYETEQPARVIFSLCRRNMIIFERWAGGCSDRKTIFIPATEYGQTNTVLQSLHTAGKDLFNLPAMLTIRVFDGTAPVFIHSMSMRSTAGEQTLDNAHFTQGSDHWFFYYDFEHLIWHIKNIYLGTFYQLGIIGSSLLVLMLVYLLTSLIKQNELNTSKGMITIGAIVGLFSFGLFGDPMDSARANLWLYFVLFGAMLPLSKGREYAV